MDGSPKQLIAQRIKDATNILVTVNRNPSVDQLAAALGLTLMLNKIDKHATAVFSGEVPHAIDFLEPGKTFESSVSSLRDFIIALDKEKADRLRYKVEDGVVRIFITPYRTTITKDDLQFTEGDFNVELIIGLGVDNKDDLDEAVRNHGRILHDATVVTINAHNSKNSLGEIDWSDSAASSLSEMLMSLSESLKGGLLDEQIANALLTGIVSATDRFSNEHTSPKVMTMAAQLMAAGANQQLITAQLQDAGAVSSPATPSAPKNKDNSTSLTEGSSTKLSEEPKEDKKPKSSDGEMMVEHDKPDALAVAEQLARDAVEDNAAQESKLSAALPSVADKPSVSDLQKDLASASEELEKAADEAPSTVQETPVASVSQPAAPSELLQPPAEPSHADWRDKIASPPSMGGTLNATTSEAEEAREAEEKASTNHTILQHGNIGQTDSASGLDMSYEETPANSYITSSKAKTISPISEPPRTSDFSGMTLSELDAKERGTDGPFTPQVPPDPSFTPQVPEVQVDPLNDARAAVDAAFGTPAAFPTPQQSSVVAPVVEHAPAPFEQPVSAPLPPLPDFSTLPPLPPQQPEQNQPFAPVTPSTPPQEPQQPTPPTPGQFQIPGQ